MLIRSFQSKPDLYIDRILFVVYCTFRDFGEDVTSTYVYESSIIMPQFRSNAVEFHKNTTPQRVDVAIGNAHQLVDDNTPPPEPVSIVATLTTDTTSVQVCIVTILFYNLHVDLLAEWKSTEQ